RSPTESLSGSPYFCSSRRRHTRLVSDWSSDVCSSDLRVLPELRLGTMPRSPRLFQCVHVGASLDRGLLDVADPLRAARELVAERSEERGVGKEGWSWWGPGQANKRVRCGEARRTKQTA